MSNKTSIPLVAINPNNLKIKESQSRVLNLQSTEPLIGPQIPAEMLTKSLRKKSLPPPVPKFEDSKTPASLKNQPLSSKEIEKQETLNKFLMEIKGEDNDLAEKTIGFEEENNDQALVFELRENVEKIEKTPEKMELEPANPVKNNRENDNKTNNLAGQNNNLLPKISDSIEKNEQKSAIFQKPDFKLNLDLISNMYKQNIGQNQPNIKKETPKKSENITNITNEKVLIPLKKKEIRLNEEYDPSKPNDYETLVAERAEKNRKSKEQERKNSNSFMEIENEGSLSAKKNSTKPSPRKEQSQNNGRVPNDKEKEFTNEEKIIKIMEKSGWKFGQGLGKNEQGMTTPLITKKTTANTAIIVNSNVDMTSVLPQELVLKKRMETQNIQSTRVLLLKNMVTKETVDEGLKEEVTEECEKSGKVLSCVVNVNTNAMNEEEEVRIFIEFEKKEHALKAFSSLNGRFFAGRTVLASFYDEKNYLSGRYDL